MQARRQGIVSVEHWGSSRWAFDAPETIYELSNARGINLSSKQETMNAADMSLETIHPRSHALSGGISGHTKPCAIPVISKI